jgi:hypothetical protein
VSEYVDEEPISEEEEAWARAYWQTLAYGELEPDDSHLRPERVARIREVLEGRWRASVRRITHHPGRSSRK